LIAHVVTVRELPGGSFPQYEIDFLVAEPLDSVFSGKFANKISPGLGFYAGHTADTDAIV
jgi:hypothetical protein